MAAMPSLVPQPIRIDCVRRAVVLFGLLLGSCGPPPPRGDRIDLVLWKNQVGLDEAAITNVLIDRFNAGQHRWRVIAQSLPQGGYGRAHAVHCGGR